MNGVIVIFFTIILYIVMATVICGLLMLYAKNAYKVLLTLQGKSVFSLITIVRAAGIFFPLLGIVMGFVNGV